MRKKRSLLVLDGALGFPVLDQSCTGVCTVLRFEVGASAFFQELAGFKCLCCFLGLFRCDQKMAGAVSRNQWETKKEERNESVFVYRLQI